MLSAENAKNLKTYIYPKKYDKARGITPYKQKVVQIVAYSQKSYAVRGALKLKQELYPIPVS